MEKLNQFCVQYYNQCTNKNKKDKKYLKQLIQKRNRIEFYKLNGTLYDFQEIQTEESEDDTETIAMNDESDNELN